MMGDFIGIDGMNQLADEANREPDMNEDDGGEVMEEDDLQDEDFACGHVETSEEHGLRRCHLAQYHQGPHQY
jgi:hypothetical protein